MEKKSVSFRFKGTRTYVHGTDIYNQLMPFLLEHLTDGPTPSVKLTIHGRTENHGDLWITDDPKRDGKPLGIKAELVLTSGEQNIFGWLTESSETITENYSYDEEAIRSRCLVSGNTLKITEDPGFTPIEIIVAANKKLMESVFPGEQGRWFFTRLQLHQPLRRTDPADLAIEYEMNLPGNTLTRSRLRSKGELIGTIYFSAVRQ